MATVPKSAIPPEIDYPDSDGKPVAETPIHRDNLLWSVHILRTWFQNEPMVYVSGNMFVYYVRGDNRRHVAPDVFVTRGIPKDRVPVRGRYLVWEEGKGPDAVIEITSRSTRREDLVDKFQLYQNVLKVREYFLFDPEAEYLAPPLQGYRLQKGKYVPIRAVRGRLPSKVLGLHLEQQDWLLRFYDPATGQWLPTPPEVQAAWRQEQLAREQAQAAAEQERAAREQAEAEIARLRRELESLRKRRPRRP
jgi:Uma2 family endonuclease